jgi:prepilin-type N-terminal cleavage/methylation domain-containing protein
MTRHRVARRAACAGFTLAELAIALVIVGLLLASAMIPLSAQVELRNVSETRRTLDQIKDAVIGFAQANGRLPCPARGLTPTGTTDAVVRVPPAFFAAGAEQYDTTNKRCYVVLGVVPWSTLGVPETDAWGRRFSYRVSPAFADDPSLTTWQSRLDDYVVPAPPPIYLPQAKTVPTSPTNQTPLCELTTAPSQSTIALCTLGDIAILTRSYSDHSVVTPLGTGVPAVIVSHGRNGFGAFQPNGQSLTPSGGADELGNSTGLNTVGPPKVAYLSYAYYSRDPTPSATGCSDTAGTVFCEFDDIVTWISPSTLVARMVSAGRLP